MIEFSSTYFLYLAAWVFAVGLYVVLTKTSAVFVLVGIELLLNAVNIVWVYFSQFDTTLNGQVIGIFTIILTVCEVAIALAILLNIFRKKKTTEVDQLTEVGS